MTKARPLTQNLAPRGLCRVEAAAYVGVSPTKFDEMVCDRRMPPAKRIDSRKVWDVRALDRAFEGLPDDGPTDDDSWSDIDAT